MAYSRWSTKEEVKDKLTKSNYDLNVEHSGIPMYYDDENIYLRDDNVHTMVIGSTGSGKTQSTTLPLLKLAIKAGESVVIHDVQGEIYNELSGELKKRNYNTIVINLDDPTHSNLYNPLYYPYELYKKGDKDKAVDSLDRLAYYFCCNEKVNNSDPFWVNSAISLFIGLSLYLFENASEDEININSLVNLVSNFDKVSDIIKKYDKSSPIYINLSNIILAPNETRGSIISVFLQQIRLFVSRESLTKMMSKSDFDITTIKEDKSALFIISNNKTVSRKLVPLIINQVFESAVSTGNKDSRLNIILDDFESLVPFKEFDKMLNTSRSFNIKFVLCVRSLLELNNTYGKEQAEIIKMVVGVIIYLIANDIETLEDISKLCGMQSANEPLVTIEDLKRLDYFEAVILIPRMYPIKTKLIPDYKIDWKFSDEKVSLKETTNVEVKSFDI